MSLLDKAKVTVYISVSITTIVATFFTIIELMIFLSDPNYKIQKIVRDNFWVSVVRSLLFDQLLLSAFVLQHSVLALPQVKSWFASLHLQVLQRSIYVITTCLVLQLVLKNWQTVPEISLWRINTNIPLLWWTFLTLHTFSWIIIYVGTICMDVNELLGVKQVYYNIQNLLDPNVYKSNELQQLYTHMRHPSFLSFLVLFWAIPFMSLDRVFLAFFLTIYMYFVWNTNRSDYHYQQLQFVKKFHELNYVK